MRLLIGFLLLNASAFGAAKYFINGGVDSNWGTAGNWASTDGGSHTSETVPSASDDVHFTANSPNCTVNASGRTALTLDFTGYTGKTITMSQQITVSGSVTLISGMTISGTGALLVNATSTLTSGGKTWPNAMTIGLVTGTYTLADNWTVSGLLGFGSTSAVTTLNSNSITCTGGVRYLGTTGSVVGTTVLKLTATQTVDAPSSTSGRISNEVDIDAGAGTVTFTAPINIDIGNMKYISGTVITSAATWASGGTTVTAGGRTYVQ